MCINKLLFKRKWKYNFLRKQYIYIYISSKRVYEVINGKLYNFLKTILIIQYLP